MEDVEELLGRAVTKMKQRLSPKPESLTTPFTPEEKHKSLFALLEVFDDRDDEVTNERAKFIYDYLKLSDKTDVEGEIVKILLKLGKRTTFGSKLDDVWRFCKISKERDKAYNIVRVYDKSLKEISNTEKNKGEKDEEKDEEN